MKKISFVFILFSILFFAQKQRFVYEYSFRIDSLNRDQITKEIMNLDVSKEGSLFYSALLVSRDSLFKSEFEKGKITKSMFIDMRKIKQPKTNFRVSKTYPGLESIYHSSVNGANLAVKETQKINWTILQETSTIEGFNVQKATANFIGRNWIAWFTNDIQIQDGPYKFSGLPGLILKVEDEKQDHSFLFIGNQKLDAEFSLIDAKKSEVYVTKEKFNFYWNEYKKDPAKNIKMMHSSSDMSETIVYNANTNSPMTKRELIQNKENRFKESIKQVNNYLEIELYK